MRSPVSRTLELCRRLGWPAGVVERFIPQARRSVDLFGFLDVVALDGKPGALGIQTTSGSNLSKRVAKARELETLARWLAAGNRFEAWGWRKVGKRGKRKLWRVRIVEALEYGAVRDRGDYAAADFAAKAEEIKP